MDSHTRTPRASTPRQHPTRAPRADAPAGFVAGRPRAFTTHLHSHLFLLRQALAGGQEVSGQELARALGRTRTAVWKAVELLRELGYGLEGSPHRGYRLVHVPDVPFPWELELCRRGRFGHPLVYLPVVGSTNDEARRLAESGWPEGTTVVADQQRAGRGRRGRAWASPAGGLWFSVVLRPQLGTPQVGLVALGAGLAVVRALAPLCRVPLALKWPNDVMAADRKLCGVLAELEADHEQVRYVVVGVGINVQSPELEAQEGSLPPVGLSELGCSARRVEVLAAVLRELELVYQRLQQDGPKALVAEVEQWLAWKGRAIRIETGASPVEGLLEGLDDQSGALRVRTCDGRLLAVASGDVTLRVT